MKPADLTASTITFGVEIETAIPNTSGVNVGYYHGGYPVHQAPNFGGKAWKAERDGSITTSHGFQACEFVSPILVGDAGVQNLIDMVAWLNQLGATVNRSCGLHITIGIESVIGTSDSKAVGEFIRKLAHIGSWHARALYGQTGTDRHLNNYSHPLFANTGKLMAKVARSENERIQAQAADQCGRGLINFKKAFARGRNGEFQGVVEFRVFAGTLNINKMMHHLATALGLVRRASQVECLGKFGKNKAQMAATGTAVSALNYLWSFLGWTGAKRPVTLGLFGKLYTEFNTYKQEALRLCTRFDARYPDANL